MTPELQLRLLLAGGWLFIVALSFQKLRLGLASKRWSVVNGTVVASSIESKSLQYGLRTYNPIVKYEYEAAGRKHQGTTFTYLGTAGWTKTFAEHQLMTRFPGAVISVFVNPSQPEQAVLVPGVHWRYWASLAVISAFFMAVAFIVQIITFIWPGCQPNCT